MYICPRCEKRYEQAPEQCLQCKRPLILNKRYRIEASLQQSPSGEDFDVVDLKSNKPMIVRELRVKKEEATQMQGVIAAYKRNVARLKALKYDGAAVLGDAFETEYGKSICYYYVFDPDAWAGLGDELDPQAGGAEAEPLPPVEGRDLDPALAAQLAKLGGGSAKPAASKPASKAPSDDDGALVRSADKPPAKSSGDGAVAGRAKVVVAVSVVVVIIAAVAAAIMLL